MKLPTIRPVDSLSCCQAKQRRVISSSESAQGLKWWKAHTRGSSLLRYSYYIRSMIIMVSISRAWAPCNRVLPSQCSACMASISTTPPANALKLGKWSKCKKTKNLCIFFRNSCIHTCNFNHRTAHANYQDQASVSSHDHSWSTQAISPVCQRNVT